MQIKSFTIDEFLETLASKSPVPGGGAAAALSAALAVSLASMVCSLTSGKRRFTAVQKDIERIAEESLEFRRQFMLSADEDQQAFLPLAAAYAMPAGSTEQKAERENAMQQALAGAAQAPLKLMRLCEQTVPLFLELLEKGNPIALSDVGVGAAMLCASVKAALLNVKINTKMMDDRESAAEMDAEADRILKSVTELLEEGYLRVEERLNR